MALKLTEESVLLLDACDVICNTIVVIIMHCFGHSLRRELC